MALDRLPYDEQRDYRQEFLNELEVQSWSSPLAWTTVPVVREGPSWWHGDEDASQSFFAAMGVDPNAL